MLGICGPQGGYARWARITPSHAREIASALLAKADEAELGSALIHLSEIAKENEKKPAKPAADLELPI